MNSYINIKVEGKNINRFINRLIVNKIDIISLNIVSPKEINVIIKKDDYKKVIKIKSIYKISIIKYKGPVEIKRKFKNNIVLIICLLVGISIIYFLSNVIFSVKVIHNNENIRKLLINELSNYGIEVHKLKKSKNQIENIKKEILNKYKDKLEWLEIESYGTSYIVRVEERLINNVEDNLVPRNVIAKKNAVILKIDASKGVVNKIVGNYVRKGEIIVDGTIRLNEEIKDYVASEATIYGEVWYDITVEYPYIYKEKFYTNNKKNVIIYNFLNKQNGLFSNLYTNFKTNYKIKLNSTFLPISLGYGEITEVKEIDKIYTEEEALLMAIERSKKEMENKLKENEYIIDEIKLDVKYTENKIILQMFYSVCEDITDYQNIEVNMSN